VADSRSGSDGITTALKEQLVLVSFLVLFAGIVSSDTYYAAFGLRYQFLDLSTEHLIYRGITALLSSWSLGIVYAAAMFWLASGGPLLKARLPKRTAWLELVSYLFVAGITATAYCAALRSGATAATADLNAKTCQLPTIQSATDTNDRKLQLDGYRILLAGKDTVVVFKPVDQGAQLPFIHLLKREDIRELVLVR
jgi:hypothetical protein